MTRVLPVALALAVLLAGCVNDDPSVDSGPTPSRSPAATPTDVVGRDGGAPTTPRSDDPGTIQVRTTVVGDGFEHPVQVLPSPQGDTLVVEQAGRLTTLDGQTLLDLTDRVTYGGERGLLGAAFVPVGEASRLFVHYSAADGATTVSSFSWPDADSDDETIHYTVPQPASNHNGGSLLVGPDDRLYLALGDGGAGNDRFGNGQRPDTPLGAILRFEITGDGALEPAGDNPFREDGDPAVWVYGLRNPWRIAFGNERLYVADVGQDAREEVSVVPFDEAAGANFGWPVMEGTVCRDEPCAPELVRPVVEHAHGDLPVCAIIGGPVYDGSAIPALAGYYLYGDSCAGFLKTIGPDGSAPGPDLSEQVGPLPGTLGFGVDADGEVYVTLANGEVRRLEPE